MNRAFRYEKARDLFPWVKDVLRALVQIIGIAEILGALGLILPAATGIYPWLTPVAAVALALLMFVAAVFHAVRREKAEAALNVLLMIMLAFIAYIRWPLMPLQYLGVYLQVKNHSYGFLEHSRNHYRWPVLH